MYLCMILMYICMYFACKECLMVDYMALVIQLELDCQVCTVFMSVGSLVC